MTEIINIIQIIIGALFLILCCFLIIKTLNHAARIFRKKRIFLICPVRGISDEEKELIDKYVEKLENEGYKVHLPYRDTDQNDKIGLRILKDNTKALQKADEIHIWYNKNSRGSIFDFGEAFILGKPIIIANPEAVKPTEEKSFENVLLELHKENNKN